jgi:hypothetical protein
MINKKMQILFFISLCYNCLTIGMEEKDFKSCLNLLKNEIFKENRIFENPAWKIDDIIEADWYKMNKIKDLTPGFIGYLIRFFNTNNKIEKFMLEHSEYDFIVFCDVIDKQIVSTLDHQKPKDDFKQMMGHITFVRDAIKARDELRDLKRKEQNLEYAIGYGIISTFIFVCTIIFLLQPVRTIK